MNTFILLGVYVYLNKINILLFIILNKRNIYMSPLINPKCIECLQSVKHRLRVCKRTETNKYTYENICDEMGIREHNQGW